MQIQKLGNIACIHFYIFVEIKESITCNYSLLIHFFVYLYKSDLFCCNYSLLIVDTEFTRTRILLLKYIDFFMLYRNKS